LGGSTHGGEASLRSVTLTEGLHQSEDANASLFIFLVKMNSLRDHNLDGRDRVVPRKKEKNKIGEKRVSSSSHRSE